MSYLEYLKHSNKILFKKNIMPEFVTFFITNRCNLKCKHCFFYKNLNKKNNELNLEEINKISRSMDDFILLSITGGEPFIRDDVSDIVKIFYENNKIKNLIIVSNGWFTEKIIKHIKQILEECPKIHLLLDISIDAIGDKHDENRGMKDCYNKAITTFKKMDELRKENPQFKMGLVMTYSKLNQDTIIDDYYNLKKELNPDSIKVSLIRGTPKDAKVKNINLNNYIKLSKIIERDLIKKKLKGYSKFPFANIAKIVNILSYKENIKIWKTNKYFSPCFAGILNVIFYSNGDVHTCEMINSSIGSFRKDNYNFKKIWKSKEAIEFRRFVKKNKCFCTHECNLYTNILFNVRYYPRIIKYLIKLYFSFSR